MGRWFASATPVDPVFADVDHENAASAAADLDGRTVPVDTTDRFDVVCIAVPLSLAADAIERHAVLATDAVVDVTGVMREPVAAMRAAAGTLERVSLHPLFGPDNAPGTVAAVVDNGGPVTTALLDALDSSGNDVFETTPETHDHAMQTVQAKTHAAVLAFALAADPVDDRFHTPVSRELAELVAAVTDGNPRVYAEIQDAFDGAAAVAAAADRIADATPAAFEALYRDAGDR